MCYARLVYVPAVSDSFVSGVSFLMLRVATKRTTGATVMTSAATANARQTTTACAQSQGWQVYILLLSRVLL